MRKNHIRRVIYLIFVLLVLTACGGESSKSNTTDINSSTTTTATATPTENITPAKPMVSNVPKSTVKDEVTIELTGEIDATVWVNDEEVATIGSDGKVEITLDTSGEEGSKTFSIVLKNAKGGVSEPLVVLIEKKKLPTATPTPTNTTSTTTPTVVTPKQGVLIDSVVAGVTYHCGNKTGKTDENGTFECSVFPAIFTVADGKLEIGRINTMLSDSKVFIQDLVGVARDNFTDPRVLKIAKLLQSLDDDGDYDTAIKIDDSAIALADAKNIDDLNITEVETLVTDNGLTVVSDEDVIYHLIDNASAEVNQTVAKDKYDVSVDKETLTFPESLEPTESLVLPNVGAKGSQYSYDFTDEENALLLNRPSFSDKNRTIIIRTTITKGTVSDTKNSPLILIHQPITDLEAVTLAKDKLNIAGVLSAIDGDVVLETSGEHGVSISWESNSDAVSASGVVTRPSFSIGNQVVQLKATITKGSESVTKVFEVMVLKLPITDAESVANVKQGLDLGDTSAVTSNLTLPTEIDGVTITWSSSSNAISNTGVINPNDYSGNDKTATLIATFTKGDASDTKEFTIVVPKLPITDAQKVAVDKEGVNIGLFGDALLEITNDITLPTTGVTYASTITWESNNTAVLSNRGEVTRPSYTTGDKLVTIVGTIINGSATDTVEVILGIKHLDMTGDEIIADGYSRLDFDDIKGSNTAMDNIVSNLSLPSNLIVDNGSNVLIKWESTPSALVDSNGTIHAPSFTDGNATVILKAIIGVPSSDNPSEFDSAFATVSKEFNLIIKSLPMNENEGISDVIANLSFDDIKNQNSDASNILTDLTLPTYFPIGDGGVGAEIKWASSNLSAIKNDGTVTRGLFSDGDTTVTLIATVGYLNLDGEFNQDFPPQTKEFIVIVKALPMYDEKAVALAKADLSFDDIKGENSDMNDIRKSLNLITTGLEGTAIVWTSDNSAINPSTGEVIQPESGSGDVTVTVTASISKNGNATDTKSFTVVVKEKLNFPGV